MTLIYIRTEDKKEGRFNNSSQHTQKNGEEINVSRKSSIQPKRITKYILLDFPKMRKQDTREAYSETK